MIQGRRDRGRGHGGGGRGGLTATGAALFPKRGFERSEFDQIMGKWRSSDNFDRRYRFTTMLKFMFHLIARGDDASHVFGSTLAVSAQFPWTLATRLTSKVSERRRYPTQILLGSMDPTYCVLLALAIWLEHWIGRGEGASSQWLFADGATNSNSPKKDIDKEANECKDALYNAISETVRDPSFVPAVIGPEALKLGAHSVRKYALLHNKKSGVTQRHTNHRARNNSMPDPYTDTCLPWADIDAARALCIGGVCVYKLKEGCGISNDWLVEHITPAIRSRFGDAIAAILAKPLLWACLDGDCADMVPENIRSRAVVALQEASAQTNLPPGENVVQKVLTIPRELDGEVIFTEITSNYSGTAGVAVG